MQSSAVGTVQGGDVAHTLSSAGLLTPQQAVLPREAQQGSPDSRLAQLPPLSSAFSQFHLGGGDRMMGGVGDGAGEHGVHVHVQQGMQQLSVGGWGEDVGMGAARQGGGEHTLQHIPTHTHEQSFHADLLMHARPEHGPIAVSHAVDGPTTASHAVASRGGLGALGERDVSLLAEGGGLSHGAGMASVEVGGEGASSGSVGGHEVIGNIVGGAGGGAQGPQAEESELDRKLVAAFLQFLRGRDWVDITTPRQVRVCVCVCVCVSVYMCWSVCPFVFLTRALVFFFPLAPYHSL